ncbi:MAG: PQQ-binding-like beta-propeller repeat protein [Verrucomicrobiales bacterium]|nr:PQQ-binding-like beta-propeller repeat protein [Verrucomicrobiales bacterium]
MPSSNFAEAKVWRAAGGDGTRAGLWPQPVRLASSPAGRLEATGAVQASVVFDAEGRAFVADMAGGVQAFAPDGKRLWRTRLEGGISATPVVHPHEPRLYVASHAGEARALDTATGMTVWQRSLSTRSDPRVLSDLLFLPGAQAVVLSSWGGRFLALDAGTGEARFTWDAGASPGSAAATAGSGQVCYGLRAVDARGIELIEMTATGGERVLHTEPAGSRGARRAVVAAAPIIDAVRGVVYALCNRDREARLVAWSIDAGRVLWACPLAHAVQATPALRADGGLLLPDLGGGVSAVSTDGELSFRLDCGADYFLAGGVCDGDGGFYVGDPGGRLNVVGKTGSGRVGFEVERSFQARPSFGPDGRLYVPCTDRRVYIFGNASAT